MGDFSRAALLYLLLFVSWRHIVSPSNLTSQFSFFKKVSWVDLYFTWDS